MDRGSLLRVWLPLVGGLYAVYFLFLRGPGPHDALRGAGLALALLGLAGIMVARYTLGRSFSVRAKATELVTTGIYARIRNPIYISGVIFLIGLILVVRRPILFVLMMIIIPMQVIRARREAQVLEAKFGDAYRQYRVRTWF